MHHRIVAAAFAGLLGTLCSSTLLALFYTVFPTLEIDFAVDPPRLMTGVYGGERDQETGLTFAWTGGDIALRLPGLDRRVPWSADFRVRGARQNPIDNPTMIFFVDGVQALVQQVQSDFTDLRLPIPTRADRPRGATITIQLSNTFVPGPTDPRPLGVMLDHVTVRPEGLAVPPPGAFRGAAISGGTLAAAIALLGVTPGSAVGAAILLGAGQGAVLAKGFAPYTTYPTLVGRMAMVIGAALVVFALASERIRKAPLRNTARFAAAFTAAALFLKLLVLLHPGMPIGDALFQAHRFQEVLRGNYYFTSIAPGNYLFPYAPGLYVVASPFADLVRREAGDIVLLRVVVAAADTAAGLLLYPAAARVWGDRRAAAFATAVYQLMPLDFLIATGGTLTSAFAQSVAVVSLTVMSAHWLRLERLWSVALLIVALLAAFLSHTSTFAILAPTTIIVALLFAWRGGPTLRSPATGVALGGVAAALLAVILYYGHFMETYRTEIARLSSETASAAADAGGRSIGQRAQSVPRYLHLYFGVPALILAGLGAHALWRRGARDRLTLTVAGWALTCGLFLLMGVLTPVDMRYYLAALPAISIAVAAGASMGWTGSWRSRLATAALLAWIVLLGVETWWRTLP